MYNVNSVFLLSTTTFNSYSRYSHFKPFIPAPYSFPPPPPPDRHNHQPPRPPTWAILLLPFRSLYCHKYPSPFQYIFFFCPSGTFLCFCYALLRRSLFRNVVECQFMYPFVVESNAGFPLCPSVCLLTVN